MERPASFAIPRKTQAHAVLLERLWSVSRWIVLLAPAILAVVLVRANSVNALLWDDWWLADDWVKSLRGELSWKDLFAVQMEHRLAVPRAISLGLHYLADGDTRAQNAISLLMLGVVALILLVMARKTLGPLRGWNWWIALAIMMAIFSPIQWQPMLWPIIFTVYVALALVTGAVAVWFTRCRRWVAFGIASFCAILATLTFATGMLAWFLVPVAMVLVDREDVPWKPRLAMAGCWFALAGLVFGLYFHDFSNDVHPQYSYGQGNENTLSHSVAHALGHPDKLLGFVAAVMGGNQARGWPVDNLSSARVFGGICLGLYLILGFWVALAWRKRGGEWGRLMLPWLLFGAMSVGTASMLSLGRMWIGEGAQAITARYTVHAIMLSAALPPMVALCGRRWLPARWAPAGAAALAIFLFVHAHQWFYGERMMVVWRDSRWSDVAMTRFCGLLPDVRAFTYVAGDGAFGCRIARELDERGLMGPPLLKDLQFSNLGYEGRKLNEKQAGFTSWEDLSGGRANVTGYATVGRQRPADLVLFTQEGQNGEEIRALRTPIFITPAEAPVAHRDFEFTRHKKVEGPERFNWSGEAIILKPLDLNLPIKAYAYDASRRRTYLIPDLRPSNVPSMRPRARANPDR